MAQAAAGTMPSAAPRQQFLTPNQSWPTRAIAPRPRPIGADQDSRIATPRNRLRGEE